LDDESETLTREDELIRKNAALEKVLMANLVPSFSHADLLRRASPKPSSTPR
jgi:hypothetical protein